MHEKILSRHDWERAKHILCWICKEIETDVTRPDIAWYICNRDLYWEVFNVSSGKYRLRLYTY